MSGPARPSYQSCLAMMRHRDPLRREEGFQALLPRASEHLAALIIDFRAEEDHGLRCWLLELIGAARSPAALELLVEQLGSPDEAIRDWAARGLQALDTPAARRALFAAGVARRRPEAGH